MTSWIERRKELMTEVKFMLKDKKTEEEIIHALGKMGVSRRTAREYIKSV